MAEVKTYTTTAKSGGKIYQLTSIQKKETQNSSNPTGTQSVIVSEEDKPSAELVYVVPGKFTKNGNYKADTGKAFDPVQVAVNGGSGMYFAGWLLGDEADISEKVWTQQDLEGLSGLHSAEATSADSPTNPYIYTCTQGVEDNSGRIVWAYPASFGKVSYFIDGSGKHSIGDSYTNRQTTVDGVEYEVYYLTTPLNDDVGQEYIQTFTQN